MNFFFRNNFNLMSIFNNFLQNKGLNYDLNIIISNLTYLNYMELGLKLKNSFMLINSFIFLNNVDNEVFLRKLEEVKDKFIIYSGSFFDLGAKVSNLILPVYMFFEYNGYFFNLEGRY